MSNYIKRLFRNLPHKKSVSLLTLFIIIAVGAFVYFFRQTSLAISDSPDSFGVISQKTSIASNKKMEKICLDPGHGGKDLGADYGKIIESKLNLEVAKKVQAILEADGYTVYLTRTDDSFVAKRSRAVYCNTVQADILVSIHHNTYTDDTSVNYSTALYYKAEDKNLAGSLLASVAQKSNCKIRAFPDLTTAFYGLPICRPPWWRAILLPTKKNITA